jgi:predicted adenine nucleotide alpha hydrolase (AANH) superfamily ATPase
LYWYNPNIYPLDEQQKRLDGLKRVAEHFGVPLIVESEPTAEEFFKIHGDVPFCEQGNRCKSCYKMRLERTAQRAKKEGIGAICTTLTVGTRKDAFAVNGVGEEIAKAYGLEWLLSDFKKNGGFDRSTALSEQLGLYRQDYCGCRASLEERR